MSTPTSNTHSISACIGEYDNKRRWYALRYLRTCTYPASIAEVSEYVEPRVSGALDAVEETLRDADIPALDACNVIEYDPESDLVWLDETEESFADRARRAISAGVLTYQKPPRLEGDAQGIIY